MMRSGYTAAGLVAAVVALLGALLFSSAGMQAAPQVDFKDLSGNVRSLNTLRGRATMVVFWATSCTSCVAEIPHLSELYEQYKGQGLSIIGVAMDYDPPQQVARMVAQRQIPYTIVHDELGEAARAFGDVMVTPATFVIDPQGKIAMNHLGVLAMDRVIQLIEPMLSDRG